MAIKISGTTVVDDTRVGIFSEARVQKDGTPGYYLRDAAGNNRAALLNDTTTFATTIGVYDSDGTAFRTIAQFEDLGSLTTTEGVVTRAKGDARYMRPDAAQTVSATHTYTLSPKLNDNVRLYMGSGSDAQILHTGADFVLSNDTGVTYIRGNDVRILNALGTETQLRADADGAVILYHNNIARVTTTSVGASITGTLTASQAIELNDNTPIRVGTSDDLVISHDGVNSLINNSTGILFVNAGDFRIRNLAGTQTAAIFNPALGSTLYYNNSAKMFTSAVGITVQGDIDVQDDIRILDNGLLDIGTGGDLSLYHDGTNSHMISITER